MSAERDARVEEIRVMLESFNVDDLTVVIALAYERTRQLLRIEGQITPFDVSKLEGRDAETAVRLNAEGLRRYLLGCPGYEAFEPMAKAFMSAFDLHTKH